MLFQHILVIQASPNAIGGAHAVDATFVAVEHLGCHVVLQQTIITDSFNRLIPLGQIHQLTFSSQRSNISICLTTHEVNIGGIISDEARTHGLFDVSAQNQSNLAIGVQLIKLFLCGFPILVIQITIGECCNFQSTGNGTCLCFRSSFGRCFGSSLGCCFRGSFFFVTTSNQAKNHDQSQQ